jgi:hypothetical protein
MWWCNEYCTVASSARDKALAPFMSDGILCHGLSLALAARRNVCWWSNKVDPNVEGCDWQHIESECRKGSCRWRTACSWLMRQAYQRRLALNFKNKSNFRSDDQVWNTPRHLFPMSLAAMDNTPIKPYFIALASALI